MNRRTFFSRTFGAMLAPLIPDKLESRSISYSTMDERALYARELMAGARKTCDDILADQFTRKGLKHVSSLFEPSIWDEGKPIPGGRICSLKEPVVKDGRVHV